MDDAKVASAQVWPRRPVDCEQLFLQARDARRVDCCATLSYSLVFQKATEPLDCKLTDF